VRDVAGGCRRYCSSSRSNRERVDEVEKEMKRVGGKQESINTRLHLLKLDFANRVRVRLPRVERSSPLSPPTVRPQASSSFAPNSSLNAQQDSINTRSGRTSCGEESSKVADEEERGEGVDGRVQCWLMREG
jgi:hypothetical protein